MSKPDPAVDASGILDAIETDRRRTRAALAPDTRLMYGTWGGAWIVGFTAVFLGSIPVGQPLIPLWVGLAIGIAALVAAIVVSAVHGAGRGRAMRGPSSIQGAIYGNAYPVAFLLMGVLGWRLIVAGVPADAMLAYWTAAPCLIIGSLGLAGAAMWNDRGQLVFSAWVLWVGFVAIWIPAPYLLLAGVGAGVGFVVIAILAALRPALVTGPIVTMPNVTARG